MNYTTLISGHDLARQLDNPDLRIVDCRFSLNDTERGKKDYDAAHISGAVYAHLDNDLSGPVIPEKTGRHPLPEPDTIAKTLSLWGIDERTQVIVYDDNTGTVAARLWWILRWLGHEKVAVLDGGWKQWQKEGHPGTAEVHQPGPRTFTPRLRSHLRIDLEQVQAALENPDHRLLDARTPERYRGEQEPIDSAAGHIPNALSAPVSGNLDPDGKMIPQEDLRKRFAPLFGDTESSRIAFYCGSGVSACQNLLAMLHAGLGDGKLYPGSWSEWITDPDRPIAKGS